MTLYPLIPIKLKQDIIMPLALNSKFFNRILFLRKTVGDFYFIGIYNYLDGKDVTYYKNQDYLFAYQYFLSLHKKLDPNSFKYNFVDSTNKQVISIENWWLRLKNIIDYNQGIIP